MDYFGTSKEMDLVPDGHNKLVTDENKEEYVRLVANFKLDKAILEQKNAFLAGFYSLVPKDLIKLFDNRELELLISGLQTIDIDDLKENTVYNGYNARSRPVLLLWEVLNELENSERAEFIQFVTGSSKVPIEGFKGLRGPDGL
jgi:E3 ubiquitin-protein ligase HUWE1